MQLKFTDAELLEIEEAVWESLDQFAGGLPVLDLKIEDVAPIFSDDELAKRQSIIKKIKEAKKV